MKLPIKSLQFSLFIAYIVQASCTPRFDVLIRNGDVFDGNSMITKQMDVAVKGDRISKIGTRIKGKGKKEINATGLVVSPGFIDVHAHIEPLPIFPQAESALRQGVTTAFGGPDGSSPLGLAAYLDTLEKIGIGINAAYLVGHGSVRAEVLGLDSRDPTNEELEKMKALVDKDMKAGAFGISTGLKYLPGAFSKTEEVVELSKVAASYGGVYTTHMREEGLGLIEAVEETITIGKLANIPVVLSHHKVIGKPMWGSSVKTLAMVDEARARGQNVMIDQYPYTASHTSISVLIPAWAMEGGRVDAFARRIDDPVLRDSIKKEIVYNIMTDRGGGDLSRVQFSTFNWKPELGGKTLKDWAVIEGLEPTPENGAELVIQAQLHRGAQCIFHAMHEDDVVRIMKHPQTMVASDGRLNELGKGHPHPRAYGTFPRVLGEYVREKKVLPLETALYKMTGQPATNFNVEARGFMKEGYFADIVVFDANTIADRATFEDPHHYPAGIHFVLVNGKLTIEGEQYHDVRAGQGLRMKRQFKKPKMK